MCLNFSGRGALHFGDLKLTNSIKDATEGIGSRSSRDNVSFPLTTYSPYQNYRSNLLFLELEMPNKGTSGRNMRKCSMAFQLMITSHDNKPFKPDLTYTASMEASDSGLLQDS